ncbi:unnamed protein product [Leptosia nina]|uniref:Uncharacterized protein n=1 Tax=Leptosia nina TaxID=320188 RepID=A0AAV1J6U9_9NEOP
MPRKRLHKKLNAKVLDTLSRILTGIIREQTLLEKQKTQSIRQKENDKSWVANIKYIRVIEKEEFDPTLKDLGSFWENCTFPKDWDENDFNID